MTAAVSASDRDDAKRKPSAEIYALDGSNASDLPQDWPEDGDPDPQGGEQFVDELKPGTKLFHGQYTIVQFLNSGGFGITYLAKDSLDRTVVIKECFPSAFCRRSNTIVRARSRAHQNDFRAIVRLFVQEARSLSKLVHPNIVGVHQVFEDNDTAYMAIDFVDGRDLLTVIEEGKIKLTPDNIFNLLKKMLEAVSFIHGSGVLHRDISPDNILVDENLDPVLIDFGAAREQASKQSRALSALRVVKDGYSPQEFYIAGSVQTDSSDLYALAASFYHLIAGEPPPNSQFRLSSIAEGQGDTYKPLAGRFEGYPAGFLEAIDKAVNVLPRDRIDLASTWLEFIEQGRRVTEAQDDKARTSSIESALATILADDNAEQTPASRRPPAPADAVLRAPPARAPAAAVASAQTAPRGLGARLPLLGAAAAIALAAGFLFVTYSPEAPGEADPAPGMKAEVAAVSPAAEPPVSESAVAESAAVGAPDAGADAAAAPVIVLPDTAVSEAAAPEEQDIVVAPEVRDPGQPEPGSQAAAYASGPARTAAPEDIALIELDAVAAGTIAAGAAGSADRAAQEEPLAPNEVVASLDADPAQSGSDQTADAETAVVAPAPKTEVTETPDAGSDAASERDPSVLTQQIAAASWDYSLPFQTLPVRVGNDPYPVVVGISSDAAKLGANAWLAEGVMIYSVNDEWVSDQTSIMDAVTKNPVVGDGYLISASARIRPNNSAPFELVTLALATTREVELLSGTLVRAELRDGAWKTTVIETADAPETGLLPGDIIISEHQSGNSVETPLSFEEIVSYLAAEQLPQAYFTVERGGETAIASSDLARHE